MRLARKLHMRCYRLHLRFSALCQSISLEFPIASQSILVHPQHRHTKGLEPYIPAYDPVSTILRVRLADVSMVEVAGTAPASSEPFSLCQQLIYYIYYGLS